MSSYLICGVRGGNFGGQGQCEVREGIARSYEEVWVSSPNGKNSTKSCPSTYKLWASILCFECSRSRREGSYAPSISYMSKIGGKAIK